MSLIQRIRRNMHIAGYTITPKRLLTIIAVALLSIILFSGFINQFLLRTRADQTRLTLSYQPPTQPSMPSGQDKQISIVMTPDQAKLISAFDITLSASGPLQISHVDTINNTPLANGAGKFEPIVPNQQTSGQQVRLAYAFMVPANQLPNLVTIQLTVRGAAAGQGSLQIINTQAAGLTTDKAFTVVPPAALQFTFTGNTGVGNTTPNGATFTPVPTNIPPNTPGPGTPTFIPTATPPATPTVIVSTATPGPSPTPTRMPTATLFPTTTTGPGTPTSTPIPFMSPSVTPNSTGGLTATLVPTTPFGSITMNFKLKFYGINKIPVNPSERVLHVRVTAFSQTGKKADSFGDFVSATDGIWQGSVTFNNLPLNEKYIFFIKGPKQLQKKFCDASPSEQTAGAYRCGAANIVLLSNGTLDFTGVAMQPGDLPQQNGIIDSYDLSLIRKYLGKKDDYALQVADVNLDGIVDSQDYALTLASLSIKHDEE